MANSMVKAPAPMFPALMDEKHIDHLVRSFTVEQDGFSAPVLLDRDPTQAERQLLQERHRRLTETLKPYGMGDVDPPCAIRAGLAAVFRGYPALKNEEAIDLIDAYMLVLQKYAKGAIQAAVADMADGRLKNHDIRFAPNSVQVGHSAAGHQTRLAAQHIKIEKILSARGVIRGPAAAGSGERIMASLQDFHGRVAGAAITGALTAEDHAKISARHRQEGRQTILREWAHHGLSPMLSGDGSPISLAMAVKLGKLVERRDRDGGKYYQPLGEVER